MKLFDKDKVVKELERRVEAIRKAFNEPDILYGVDRTYANAMSFSIIISYIVTKLFLKKVKKKLIQVYNKYFFIEK